jgi:YggT family protein
VTVPLALTRSDLADYVDSLFLVYIILIFVWALSSFLPRIPYHPWLRAALDFVNQVTLPYLRIFRRFLPMVGGGGMALDLSPLVGTIVLLIARNIVVGLIRG